VYIHNIIMLGSAVEPIQERAMLDRFRTTAPPPQWVLDYIGASQPRVVGAGNGLLMQQQSIFADATDESEMPELE